MNRFLKNVAWLTAGRFTSQIITFAIGIYLFNNMGPDGMGLYASIFVLLGTFGLFLLWEPGNVLVHTISKETDSSKIHQVAHEAFVLMGAVALFYSVIFFSASPFLIESVIQKFDPPLQLLAESLHLHDAIILTAFLPILTFPVSWSISVLKGLEEMKSASLIITLQSLARPAGAFVGFLVTNDLKTMVNFILATHLLTMIFSLYCFKKHLPNCLTKCLKKLWIKPRPGLVKPSLLLSFDKKISDWLNDLLPKQLLLISFPTWLAYFEILFKLYNIIFQILTAINVALLPRLTNIQLERGWRGIKNPIRKTILWCSSSATLIGIFIAFISWHILFPHKFFYNMTAEVMGPVGKSGLILLCTYPFVGFGTVSSSLVIILEKLPLITKINIIAAAFTIPLAYHMISHYGIVGACLYFSIYRISVISIVYLILSKNIRKRVEEETALEKT